MTDEELIDRVQQGDHDAYRQLVERHQAFVFTTILSLVNQRELAEDLAQETFLQAYRSLPKFKVRSRFSTWLYRIARNKVIDWSRSKAKKAQSHEMELKDIYTADNSFEDEVVMRDTTNRLRKLMRELPPHYRDVLTMHFERELSIREIAGRLNIPHKTAQTRFIRGKKRLFQRWQEVNRGAVQASAKKNVATSRSK